MIIKNNAYLLGAFVCLWGTAQAELSYMDRARISPILVGPHRMDRDRLSNIVIGGVGGMSLAIALKDPKLFVRMFDIIQPSLVVGFDNAVARPLDLKCHDSLEKVIKYNAWYARQVRLGREPSFCSDGSKNKDGILSIAEPAIFLAADHLFDSYIVESDVVKKGLEFIPENYRKFTQENGQFVLTAGATRLSSAVLIEGRDGLSLDNAYRFGKSAAIQVGAQGLEDYIINPTIEKMVGSEDSTTKTIVSGVANYGVLLAINYFAN